MVIAKTEFSRGHTMKPVFLSVLLLLFPMSALSQDAPVKAATCVACHGVGGAAPILPVYPKLNGQSEAYLVNALKAYRDGQRQGGFAAIMTAQAAALSDEEINELAAYYSEQP